MSEATFFARFAHLIVLVEEMDLRFSLGSVCFSVQMRPSVRRRRHQLIRHLPQTTRQTWVGKSHNFPLFSSARLQEFILERISCSRSKSRTSFIHSEVVLLLFPSSPPLVPPGFGNRCVQPKGPREAPLEWT